MMTLQPLVKRAAYLTIDNAAHRNALSLSVLRSLKRQLESFNKGSDGRVRILPPFKPGLIDELEMASKTGSRSEHSWLVHSDEWKMVRNNLPKVIVLRTEGPVFSSGHDLKELRRSSYDEVKETFALCAEVMTLIRRSPAPVVAVIQGLATAAGAQLAFTTDYQITVGTTKFQLPGASIGLPCTSPSTALARRLGSSFTYRMLATAEPVMARDLPRGVVEIVEEKSQFEERVANLIDRLANGAPAQPTAFGKWAYWTHLSLNGSSQSGADGYEDAVAWAGRAMALHARSADAQEGISAFSEKRKAEWVS